MIKNFSMSWSALALAAMIGGCGSKTVDLGDDRDPALLGASLSDYQGTWVGYAEVAMWNDGTGTLRVQLDAQGNGVLEVGEAAPLPPPVAGEGYPPDYEYYGTTTSAGLISGYSYPISNAIVESKRIRLKTRTGELFREYCDIQTPMSAPGWTPSGYNCLGYDTYSTGFDGCQGIGGGNPNHDVMDCALFLCITECVCTETECHAFKLDEDFDTLLDAQLEDEGESLEGTLRTLESTFQVVMTRE
jgi:hypothetical protein